MTATERSGRRRWWPIVTAVVGACLIAALVVIAWPGGESEAATAQLTFSVRRGPLTINVNEGGTIKARDLAILKNEVEGQTTIIRLIEEGTMVKRGDLLVELDASRLQDDKIDQQIQVKNAEAAHIQSKEALAVAESQARSDIAQAELDYRFAQEDLKQYVDGEYPKLLQEAEANIQLAEEESVRATEKLEWSEKLFKEKYISQTERDADRLTMSRARLGLDLAKAELRLLEKFTYHRKIAQLESDIEQTQMALERVKRKADADIIQARADLEAKELEFQQQQSKLSKIEDQINKTRIYAPLDGMAIYATSARGSWRGNEEPLDEGQTVRERQELIYLPTAEAMVAEVKLHESSLEKVRPGLPARITVDALPGQSFSGTVMTIAPLPDAQMMWMNPDLKVYTTRIELDERARGLRTGMSCMAEIIVDRYEDALYVPVQTVLRVGGQATVFVRKGVGIEARPVVLGLNNNRMVRILEGLSEGEEVLLAPPLERATASAEQEDRQAIEVAGGADKTAETDGGKPEVSEQNRLDETGSGILPGPPSDGGEATPDGSRARPQGSAPGARPPGQGTEMPRGGRPDGAGDARPARPAGDDQSGRGGS